MTAEINRATTTYIFKKFLIFYNNIMDIKRHYFLIEIAVFFIVLLCFVLPSILISKVSSDTFVEWRFPFYQLLMVFFSFFVLMFFYGSTDLKGLFSNFDLSGKWILFSGRTFLSFGIIVTTSVLLQIIEIVLRLPSPLMQVSIPSDFIAGVFCVLTFISGAILEENMFRIYVPEFMIKVCAGCRFNKFVFLSSELFCGIIFALCHRYLGIIAVINAFACHIVLRLTFKKHRNPFVNYTAHFLYNILNVVLLGLIE